MTEKNMGNYNFVKFDGVYLRGEDKVSIQKSGLMRLSPKFVRTIGGEGFKWAILFYDNKKKAIAIKFTSSANEGGTLRVTQDKNGRTISALSFLKANKIAPKDYLGRHDAKEITLPNEGKVFVIDLEKK